MSWCSRGKDCNDYKQDRIRSKLQQRFLRAHWANAEDYYKGYDESIYNIGDKINGEDIKIEGYLWCK